MRRITAHCLVKNEARFSWYAVMSVIGFVDEVLVWDTGSTDGTFAILEEIKKKGGDKVKLREVGEVDVEGFARVRQEMLEATKTDWFVVVDGDEIWWDESIGKVVEKIQEAGDRLESIVVPTYNLVGDIFHYQEEAAGKYQLAGEKGHLSLRAVNRKIPGLRSYGQHGTWGWVDGEGRMIQDRDPKRIAFVDAPYLHATHLRRAGNLEGEREVPKRQKKLKYELGREFPKDFYYPEVFFRDRPGIVASPWEKMSFGYKVRAAVETPLKMARRRLIRKGKVGY